MHSDKCRVHLARIPLTGTAMSLSLMRHAQNHTVLVRGELDRPVHDRQWYEFPNGTGDIPETWCYTDPFSVSPGEDVFVYGISTADRVTIDIRRCGLNGARMTTLAHQPAVWEDTPQDASVHGCHWPVLARVRTDASWQSGVYRITVRPTGRREPGGGAQHLFVVRPSCPNPKRLLLITADCTWLAYNDWGGSNHYEGVVDPQCNRFSAQLSRLRPFARGFITLPIDAPRTLPSSPPEMGSPVRYPHMEWAWNRGYSKKFASAGWASYERHFFHWAEVMGYSLDVVTQLDLHYRPEILSGYRCATIVGHDEYWSWKMRDAVDQFVEEGGRIARFAGNFFWQVRMEEEGQSQICHKYRCRDDDPMYHSASRHLTTNIWESPEVNRPGHATFGLDGSRGVYAGWGGLARHGAGGFTVFRPEHWALQGCGLGYGDLLGANSRIFGYEVDGLEYRIENGLPTPISSSTLPDDLQILALGFARLREDRYDGNEETRFVGDADAYFVARQVYGSADPHILSQVDRGAGMVVSFTRGTGQVFNAGTTEWVAGLLRNDPGVTQVTRNVLNRFLDQ